MATVRVRRTEDGLEAADDRGARMAIGGANEDGAFSPVELPPAALGGWEPATVEPLTAERYRTVGAGPEGAHAGRADPSRAVTAR